MVAWTTTSQPLIGSNSQEYVPKKGFHKWTPKFSLPFSKKQGKEGQGILFVRAVRQEGSFKHTAWPLLKTSWVPSKPKNLTRVVVSWGTVSKGLTIPWYPRWLLWPLSRNILWIFSSNLPGNFALKNGGDFWWIFSGLHLPQNEARKLLEKLGENSEPNSGQNSGWKFEKFGKLSFCNFPDLIDGCRKQELSCCM